MRIVAPVLLLTGCSTGFAPNTTDTPSTDRPAGETGPRGDTSTGTTGVATIPDQAPVADAGADNTAAVAAVATLDGTGSYDPDGDALTWTWAFLSIPTGSGTTLLDETTAAPTFWVDRPGTYEVRLTVSDGELATTDDVTITASSANSGPVAIAGPDQIVTRGDTVQLNGSSSYDPENDALTFAWTLASVPAGSTATLVNGTGPLPQFVADMVGTYVVDLRVSDGTTESPPDELQVVAQSDSSGGGGGCSCNPPPGRLPRSLAFVDVAGGFAPFVAIPFGLRVGRRKRTRRAA